MGAAAAGASFATKTTLLRPTPLLASPRPVAASDRLRFGMIGVGMQGSQLLAQSILLPGIACVAACDLYDGRHTVARETTGKADLPVTRRYQELLANKDIDCIVAAVPDHWHRQIVVDAVTAGKDIYCEKPMSHSAAEGVDMVEAAKKTGRIVQIGAQRVSSLICAKGRELIAQGALGDLMMVEGWLGRNDPTGSGCLLGASPLGCRPNQVGDPNAGSHTYQSWFNAGAFAAPAATQTTETTERPGAIRGPGFWRTDLSLFKNMKFGERVSGQLRWETFNTFNHTNPICCASTSFSSTLFDKVTSTRDPRIMQLGLKVNF